jgi:hypothetical protein
VTALGVVNAAEIASAGIGRGIASYDFESEARESFDVSPEYAWGVLTSEGAMFKVRRCVATASCRFSSNVLLCSLVVFSERAVKACCLASFSKFCFPE